MENLRNYVIDFFLSKQESYDLFVPYEDGKAHSQLRQKTNIIKTKDHEKGIFYRIKSPDFFFKPMNLGSFILGEHNPLNNKFYDE